MNSNRANTTVARKAMKIMPTDLSRFSEFAGVGVVPNPDPEHMAVAVYVTSPSTQLSRAFKSSIPDTLSVSDHGKKKQVSIKIVEIGEILP